MLCNIVEEPNEIEKKLIKKFWPGPLTIIFKGKENSMLYAAASFFKGIFYAAP